MHKHLIKLIIAVCFVFLFSSINGCGDKTAPPTKPAAVSKKIVAKKSETAPAGVPAAVNAPAKQGTEIKEAKTDVSTAKTGSGPEKPVVSVQPPVPADKGKQGETVKTTSSPALQPSAPDPAVSKKIVAKKSETAPAGVPAAVNAPAKQGTEIKEAKTDVSTAKTGSGPEKPAVSVQPPVPADKGKQGETVKTASSQALQPSAPDPAAEIAKMESETIPVYNPQGRIDPFIPLFKEEGPLAGDEKEKKGRIPRTPLEMIDLGQLKLVAVMRAPSGNKALVEEASGKGYIVAKGTYLGVNSGRVVKILKDRVIIEEKVESIVGKSTIQERELKLQKPLGEE